MAPTRHVPGRGFFRPTTLETGKQEAVALGEGQRGKPCQAQDLSGPSLQEGNQVSDFELCMPCFKEYLRNKHEAFQAGQIKTKLANWEKLTSDPEVIETVTGMKIHFDERPETSR